MILVPELLNSLRVVDPQRYEGVTAQQQVFSYSVKKLQFERLASVSHKSV